MEIQLFDFGILGDQARHELNSLNHCTISLTVVDGELRAVSDAITDV